jgi:hypothetical protein
LRAEWRGKLSLARKSEQRRKTGRNKAEALVVRCKGALLRGERGLGFALAS